MSRRIIMKSSELNLVPAKLAAGEISKKEAVNIICAYLNENFPVFGLHKYDEDFREDVIVYFLERGSHVLDLYDSKTADFFTFLYSNIMSYIQTRKRTIARESLKERITLSESASSISDQEYAYNKIDYKKFEIAKAPYYYSPITVENLKKIFEPISKDMTDKKILVLAMKSSYYLSDSMIKKISHIYNINEDDMYKTIQFCKESIAKRSQKHQKAIEHRNYAYYHHKKYKHELENVKTDSEKSGTVFQLEKKYFKHSQNWKLFNEKFEKGFLYLRPTNKTISEILGICERQVAYYINCAKKEFEKTKNEKEIHKDD